MYKRLLLVIFLLAGYVTAVKAEDERGVIANTCDPYGFVLKKKRVQESLRSINLSKAFLNGNKVSYTWTTSWSGKMNCLGTADYAYFFSAIDDRPFYVLFASAYRDSYYWIKFNLKVEGPPRVKVRGLPGVYSIARYRTDYTLTAELLTEKPQDAEGRSKMVTTGLANLPAIVMSGHGDGSNSYGGITGNKYTYASEVWDYVMQGTPASGWNTDHYLAFEQLAIQFEPTQTTCDLPHDMTVMLNPVTIDSLNEKGGTAGEKAFTLPVSCDSLQGGNRATRNVTAWLASNDLIEDGDTGYVMVNDDSDALGVGIALRQPGGNRVVIANGIGSAPGTTELLHISKDQDTGSRFFIRLVAYYQVYDKKVLSTGSVLGTAQLMFNYD
ncbi:fimbrial protein [Entomohabitans teleogrylli]|uniref:fimbrial protein n=1 Tax=Entomohabitans teleogrylli TaxID=1384589 RepID=UPI00073D2B46|nr:fimbrial protein [Entomohabitans teleogrylli]